MALQLSHAVSDGIRRTLTRTGGILFLGFLAIQFGMQTIVNSTVLGYLPPEAAAQFSRNAGLALPMPGNVGLALFGVLLVLSSVYFVILSRTFAQPLSEMSTFPATSTHRLGRATVTALVGGLLVSITVMIGFVLLFSQGCSLRPRSCFSSSLWPSRIGVSSVASSGAGGSHADRLKLALLVLCPGCLAVSSASSHRCWILPACQSLETS